MNEHLPIEDLPEYLKSHRDYSNLNNVPVVGMGKIITSKKNWYFKYTPIIFAIVVVFSVLGYALTEQKNVTIVISTTEQSDPLSIEGVVRDEGGKIVSIEKKDNNLYEVIIKFSLFHFVRRPLLEKSDTDVNSFIEKIKKNKDIIEAEIK